MAEKLNSLVDKVVTEIGRMATKVRNQCRRKEDWTKCFEILLSFSANHRKSVKFFYADSSPKGGGGIPKAVFTSLANNLSINGCIYLSLPYWTK